MMVPLPDVVLERLIHALQTASAEATSWVLLASGVPFVREGFVFNLPGVNIFVAEQCSGIRSCLALSITGLLAGHLFLDTFRSKTILFLSVFPIAILKNGVRIATLSLLAVYWDVKILDGDIHSRGGIPIFALALIMMAGVLRVLRRIERRRRVLA
jgi:exosortase